MKTANRARRNSGKKARPAQSANAPKSAPGETSEDFVWIQLIDAQGNIHTDLKITPALYAALLASVPGPASTGQPVAELAPCSVILNPIYETGRKSIVTTIEISQDVVDFIDNVAGGPGVKFTDAFHRCVVRGMDTFHSQNTVKDASHRLCGALSKIEDVHNQMNFFVESVRAAMATWEDEGTWTKEHRDRMQVGFMNLWHGLDFAAREHTCAAREATRQSHQSEKN